MKVDYINPFLEALINVLKQLGVKNVKRGDISRKGDMVTAIDITSVIGIIGDVRGNISYSFSQETAKKIVALMMMTTNIQELDYIGRSAIGELSNMITGTAASILEDKGILIDISPPSIIFGKEVTLIISRIQTISIIIETSLGNMEVNIGLEI